MVGGNLSLSDLHFGLRLLSFTGKPGRYSLHWTAGKRLVVCVSLSTLDGLRISEETVSDNELSCSVEAKDGAAQWLLFFRLSPSREQPEMMNVLGDVAPVAPREDGIKARTGRSIAPPK
jgi:hypothetical protein